MVYDRNSGDGSRNDDYGGGRFGGRDQGGGAGQYGVGDRGDWGRREYGNQGYRRYDQPDREARGQQGFGDRQDHLGQRQEWADRGGEREWRGGYASDEPRFAGAGRYRNADDDRGERYQPRGGYVRGPQSEDDDRGFLQRAGDEVRSWFGDEEAERRREADARYEDHEGRSGGGRHDDDYRQWRNGQVSQFDRDYQEYRQENRAKFESEFATWRTARQSQRELLRQVREHAEVLGADGQHVGTVDKTRDDRILLTKTDADAGGRHHSIPSRWIAQVADGTITLAKTAAEAKAAWEDEDRNSALFGYGDGKRDERRHGGRDDTTDGGRDAQGRMLNRSFSGTY